MPLLRIGSRRVVEHGTAVVGRGVEEIEIGVLDLRFILRFMTDERAGANETQSEKQADKSLLINFINWHSRTAYHVRVGVFEEHSLFLSIYSIAVGDANNISRFLSYVFSVEEGKK